LELKYICFLGTIKKLKGIAFAINPARRGFGKSGLDTGNAGQRIFFSTHREFYQKPLERKSECLFFFMVRG